MSWFFDAALTRVGYNDSFLDFIISPLCLDCQAAVKTDTDNTACCQKLITR